MSPLEFPAEPSVKYESPYEFDSAPNAPNALSLSPRKRRSSNQESPEKRQRIDEDDDANLVSPEFAAFLSQTAIAAGGNSNGSMATRILEEETAYLGLDGAAESDCVYDPYYNMRILSLPILESLSVQIVSTLTEGSYTATVSGIANRDSEFYQAHATLVSLFDQTKKIYSTDATFLSAEQLNIKDPKHKKLIHMTNVATYVAAVFGGSLGLGDLDENFLDTFAPEGAPLERDHGDLLLNLKTQMYLSSVSQEEQEDTKEDLLDRYLSPAELRQNLQNRHLLVPLTDAEEQFLKDCETRTRYLMSSANNIETIQALMSEFPWEDYLMKLHEYVRKDPLTEPYVTRHALPKPSPPLPEGYSLGLDVSRSADDFSAQISFAAQAALEKVGERSQGGATVQTNQTNQQNGSSLSNTSATKQESTKALYDKARQAAAAKSNPGNARSRPGMPSQRRPWSSVEENALMTGLDQVKGPHWSQILGLYGQGGSINNVLKDRNQVQLKDKARNIKLFFLKSGFEVPSYLKHVTGELKTRAPTQAARREAEERARLAGTEEQDRIEVIQTLAGGLQTNDQTSSQHSSEAQSMSPQESASREQEGPEEFQVVEPENDQPSAPTPQPDHNYEQLRQALVIATNAVVAGS
ncbi:hypothetical protein BDZ45DRAFT_712923 [Acephala macrosclerotiorum]|nr:hypothetical protein BDZ45DRAFT_712923 [Acephala macrosclerotiorum]